eukprot:4044810-Amphidinium_carterae.1
MLRLHVQSCATSTFAQWSFCIPASSASAPCSEQKLLRMLKAHDILVLVMLAFVHEPSCPRRQGSCFLVLRIAP